MIDYDLYNERRQQLIERFDVDIPSLIEILGLTVADVLDLTDWDDCADLAEEMGWTIT